MLFERFAATVIPNITDAEAPDAILKDVHERVFEACSV